MLKDFSKKLPRKKQSLPNDSAPWSPLRAVVGTIVSFIVAQTVILFIVYPFLLLWVPEDELGSWLSESVAGQFTYSLLTSVITVLVLWLFWRKFQWAQVKRALGLARRVHWHDLFIAVAGVVVYFGIYLIILTVVGVFVPVDTEKEQAIGFQTAQGFLPLLLTFISLAVLPPIVEELTFRGYLFAGFKKWLGVIGATILTSVMFALPHLLTGKDGLLWVAVIDTFALSLVLCYLREKTGALYAPIFVHAFKNAIAFIAIFVLHLG